MCRRGCHQTARCWSVSGEELTGRDGYGALLDEAILRLQVEEGLLGNEMVVHAMLLAGAGAAGRVRYGKREVVGVSLSDSSGTAIAYGWQRAYLEEQLVESALADARGPGDNDGTGIAN